ncbi:MAG: STAS domain-containing protein [Herpetosiphonaceae bacterium]|nr:STAS domain-containing protein [Herpetosiphonaceae bacterium]
MNNSFRHWLNTLAYPDPVRQQQAKTLQLLLLCNALGTTTILPIAFLAPIGRTGALAIIGATLLLLSTCFVALWLLRHNRFRQAVFSIVFGLTVFLGVMVVGTGINASGATLLGFSLPMTIGALLAGRRLLWATFGLSLALIIGAAILESVAPALTGFAAPKDQNIAGVVGGYLAVGLVLVVVLSRFSTTLYQAIKDGRRREADLQQLKGQLEVTVAERTATLQTALDELASRAAAQEQLISTTQAQRVVIQQLGVPIIPLGTGRLIVPLVGQLDDDRMATVLQRVLEAIVGQSARHVLLDITGVPFVDSAIASALSGVISASRLVGAQTVLVGINPEVAQTLVASGIDVTTLPAFATLEQALQARLW